MVWSVIPAPGAVLVSTLRYPSARVPVVLVSPSKVASCLSGRNAIRLPPALTQLVNMVTCAAVSAVPPSRTTSYWPSTVAVTADRSATANSFRPSVRSTSAVKAANWPAAADGFRITSTGPPGPCSGPGGGGAAVLNDQLSGAIVLPAGSRAPLTAAVYDVEVARAPFGVKVAVVVAGS